MSDLKKYISKRKASDLDFAQGYDEGFEEFKIGLILRQEREKSGLTQEELAMKVPLCQAGCRLICLKNRRQSCNIQKDLRSQWSKSF